MNINQKKSNPVNSGLEKYSGVWTNRHAAHLLRRTMFGPSYLQIRESWQAGLDQSLDMLFDEQAIPSPPVYYNFDGDPNIPLGGDWTEAPLQDSINVLPHRRRSMHAWLMKNIYEEGVSIREKMVVFWHNHFVTSNISDPKFDFQYFKTLRENALGNFRDFTKIMTINPSMLRYLNGNQNKKNSPNENYARELLELFTIGKGPLAAEGDYSNYTENDISEIARILTGWKDLGFRSKEWVEVSSFFRSFQHDLGEKQLSHRFDDVVIPANGEYEYADLIDIIFSKKEVARFISRKMYRWFIYHIIDEQTEINIIEPMADLLIQNDYDIQPALRTLLESQHFFDFINHGSLIKNPLDFIFSVVKSLEVKLPEENLNLYYSTFLLMYGLSSQLQMTYGDPPSVAGWKAYYQEPSYYEIWINSVTLPYRMNFTKAMSYIGVKVGDVRVNIDVLGLLEKLENPSDIQSLIDDLSLLLYPVDLTENQKNYLKEILIPGLPDYEWTVEYWNYKDNLDDDLLVASMENKLRYFISSMLSMPEFYLS